MMENILYAIENNVGYITLNRPDKSNALLTEVKKEFTDLLRQVKNDPEVRSLVITGAGKNFCAGGDLTTMGNKQTSVQGRERMRFSYEWFKELYYLEKPVIAAVNGAASGAGFGLALACDMIIAADNAKFISGAIRLGIVIDMASLYMLPRRIGIGKAKQIVYTGRPVLASEAEQIGLVDKITTPENLLQEVKIAAEEFAQGPTYAIGLTKNIINRCFETDVLSILDFESAYQSIAFLTEDHQIALKAFFEKEKPNFVGR